MKRILVVAPIAVAAALIQAGTTAAAAEWCSDDPAIYLVDAAGNRHTVYLTTYGEGLEHKPQVSAQSYAYSLESADGGHKTKVKLQMFVPDGSAHHFHVHSVVSTGPNGTGRVLAHHDGDSGHANAMDFELES